MCNCNCKCYCCGIFGVILSVVMGVTVASLVTFNLLSFMAVAVVTIMIIAAIILLVALAMSYVAAYKPNCIVSSCLCKNMWYLVISSVASVLFGFIYLVLVYSGYCFILLLFAQLFIGLTVFAGTLSVLSLVCVIICIIKKNCKVGK